MTEKHELTISRMKDLKTLVDEASERDPADYFYSEVGFQALEMSIEAGNRKAADKFLRTLANDLIKGETAPLQVLRIAEILNTAIDKNLSYRLLSRPKQGRKQRDFAKCVEIYFEVMAAKKKYSIPIKSGRSSPGGDHESDAIGQIAKERKERSQTPWAYDTVRKYYDRGRIIYGKSIDQAFDAFARLEDLLSRDDNKESNTEVILTRTDRS